MEEHGYGKQPALTDVAEDFPAGDRPALRQSQDDGLLYVGLTCKPRGSVRLDPLTATDAALRLMRLRRAGTGLPDERAEEISPARLEDVRTFVQDFGLLCQPHDGKYPATERVSDYWATASAMRDLLSVYYGVMLARPRKRRRAADPPLLELRCAVGPTLRVTLHAAVARWIATGTRVGICEHAECHVPFPLSHERSRYCPGSLDPDTGKRRDSPCGARARQGQPGQKWKRRTQREGLEVLRNAVVLAEHRSRPPAELIARAREWIAASLSVELRGVTVKLAVPA